MEIGTFARAGRLSVRMLRHYDQIGLLKPRTVDPWTGRRRYAPDQLADLHRLLALKTLGFSLAELGELTAEPVEPSRLQELLVQRRAELIASVRGDSDRLVRVEARLRMMSQEADVNDAQIQTREVPARAIAALRLEVSAAARADVSSRVEPLFTNASELAEAAGVSRLLPIGWYTPTDRGLMMHAGFADPGLSAVPGMELVHLPAATVASLLHVGSVYEINSTYTELQGWARSQGHRETGRWREIYSEADDGLMDHEWVVEVQLELDPATSP